MPPFIALSCCIFFIICTFCFDRETRPLPSPSSWLPLIWILLTASKSISYWMNPTQSVNLDFDYKSGNPIDRAILSLLMALGFIILCQRKINWKEIFKKNILILILFLYIGISIFWSDFSTVASKRWIRSLGDVIMVFVLLTEKDPCRETDKLIRRCAFILLPLSLVLIKYYRYIGVAYTYFGYETWVGVTPHKNSLGSLASICAIYFLWKITVDFRKINLILLIEIFYLVLSVILLKGSHDASSKSSQLVFIVGIYLLLLNSNKLFKNHLELIILFSIILFLSFEIILEMFLMNSLVNFSTGVVGRDATLTGRTDLWEVLLFIGSKNFFFGVGYGSFWIGNLNHNLWDIFEWGPESAHCGYIDVFIDTGFTGIILIGFIIIQSYQRIGNNLKEIKYFEYERFKFVLLTMIVIANITESSFLKPTDFLWFLFLLITIETRQILYHPKAVTNSPNLIVMRKAYRKFN